MSFGSSVTVEYADIIHSLYLGCVYVPLHFVLARHSGSFPSDSERSSDLYLSGS